MNHFEWDKKKNKVFYTERFWSEIHGPLGTRTVKVGTWLETVFDFGNRNSRAITSLMPWWIFQEWPVAYCVCHKYVRRGLINIWIEMEFVTMGLRVPDEREMTRSRRPLAPSRSHKWNLQKLIDQWFNQEFWIENFKILENLLIYRNWRRILIACSTFENVFGSWIKSYEACSIFRTSAILEHVIFQFVTYVRISIQNFMAD